jgi:hypothetical protein
MSEDEREERVEAAGESQQDSTPVPRDLQSGSMPPPSGGSSAISRSAMPPSQVTGASIHDTSVPVTSRHINVDQALLTITEDRLRLVLNQHLRNMEARFSWIAPLGILISIIVTLATTDFKEFVLDPPTWRAIFILSGILTGTWLIRSLVRAMRSESVEDVIEKLRRP